MVAVDAETRRSWRTKIPSDVGHLTANLVETLTEVRRRAGAAPGDIEAITIGHTVGLNALLERRGARTALVTTAGFRDVLEIGRESRAALFDLQQDPKPLLVPRHLRFEVDERMDHSGSVLRPLAAEAVDALAGDLLRLRVQSAAICLLHSYANPAHEIAVRDRLRQLCPELEVCASHEVLSENREYERSVLTVLNAYVLPTVARFVDELSAALGESEPQAELFVTDSAGGAMATVVSRRRAIHSALSGPAAGVRAAAMVGASTGDRVLLTLDIGGTSCDVGLVRDGEPVLSDHRTLGGFPLGLQSVDVESVGAGGGSVAWVDAGGLLRVGPRSAGAVPGPACYGRGGAEPTVTDAHLVLGHLDPTCVLGDGLRLDVELARAAIRDHVADPLALGVDEAAAGIVAIADAGLVRALEVISIERGYDPRQAALVTFGGAGPLHCGALAIALEIRRVIIPSDAGVLCALGALTAEERYEFSQTRIRDGGTDQLGWLRSARTELARRAKVAVPEGAGFSFDLLLQMRYVGQTATIPIRTDIDSEDALDVAHKQFEEAYQGIFGYSMPRPTEIDSVRLVVHRDRGRVALDSVERSRPGPGRPWRASFGTHGFMDCKLFALDDLAVGHRLPGPAVVTSATSTALVMPGQTATLDLGGNIVLEAVEG